MKLPLPARVAIWPADFVWPSTVNCVIDSGLKSMSESLDKALPARVASSLPVRVSATRVGASLTAVTVSVRADVDVRLPSVMV